MSSSGIIGPSPFGSLPISNPENGPGFETNQIMIPADSPAAIYTVMNHVLLGRLFGHLDLKDIRTVIVYV